MFVSPVFTFSAALSTGRRSNDCREANQTNFEKFIYTNKWEAGTHLDQVDKQIENLGWDGKEVEPVIQLLVRKRCGLLWNRNGLQLVN